jgi:hypothetical protein
VRREAVEFKKDMSQKKEKPAQRSRFFGRADVPSALRRITTNRSADILVGFGCEPPCEVRSERNDKPAP